MKDAKNKQKNQRQLKIYSKYFERSFKSVILPEIRLCGKWLLDNGFTCGQFVTIELENNKLTITVNKKKTAALLVKSKPSPSLSGQKKKKKWRMILYGII